MVLLGRLVAIAARLTRRPEMGLLIAGQRNRYDRASVRKHVNHRRTAVADDDQCFGKQVLHVIGLDPAAFAAAGLGGDVAAV